MNRQDILAEYVSDQGQHIRIVECVRGKTGVRETAGDDLEHAGRFMQSCIEVRADGKTVESIPLTTELAQFSRRDANNLLSEINALKDSGADPDEVIGELHTLLG